MEPAVKSFYSASMAEHTVETDRDEGTGSLGADEWYDLVVEASADGSWFYDIDKGRIHYSPSFLNILDLRTENGPLTAADFLNRVHPDDREGYKRTLARHLKGETDVMQAEVRVLSDSGEHRWVLSRGIARRDRTGHAYCMLGSIVDITRRRQLEDSLRTVALSTTGGAGPEFFESLARYLAEALGSDLAMVGRLEDADGQRVKTLAIHRDGQSEAGLEYDLAGTPCQNVLAGRVCAYPGKVAELFPRDDMLVDEGIEAYIGSPLLNTDGDAIGIIAAMFRRPVSDIATAEDLLKIFAARAAAELERQAKVEALRQSETRFRDFAEAASDWFWEMSPELRFSYLSDRIREISGVSAGFFLGKTRREVMGNGGKGDVERHFRDIDLRRPFRDFVYHVETPDGRRYFKISGKPVFDGDGSFLGYRGTGTDITAMKTAEEALERYITDLKKTQDELRRSQARLSEAQRMADLGSFEWDFDNDELACSNEINRILGLTPGAWTGTHEAFLQAVHPEDRERVREARHRATRQRRGSYRVEHRILRPDGEERVVQERGEVVRGDDDHPARLVSAVQDVTDRVHREQALARSEQRYRELYHHTPVMLHSIDREGRIVAVSGYWLQYLGYREEDVLGRPSSDFLTEESRRRALEEVLPEFFRTGVCHSVPYQIIKADGEVIDVLLSAVSEFDAGGNLERSLAVMTDVTEQRRAEAEYRDIFNHATEGIYRVTPDGRLLKANPALVRMHGYETEAELIAAFSDLAKQWYVDPADRGRITRRLAREGRVDNFEAEIYRRATGERIWVSENARAVRDENGSLLYYEGTVHDVTERRRLEAEYRDMFDSVGEGIYRSTPDGALVRANPALARLQGFSSPEELFEAVKDLNTDWYLEPGKRAELRRLLNKQGYLDDFEAEVKRLNGNERIWTSETVRATRDADGSVMFYEGSVRDITAEYKARQLARQRGEVLEMIARDASLSDVLHKIVAIAGEQQEDLVAAVFRLQNGRFDASAVPGLSRACIEAIDGSTPGKVGSAILESLHSGREAIEKVPEDAGDAHSVFLRAMLDSGYGSVFATPLRDQEGKVLGVLTAFMKQGRRMDGASTALLHEIAQIASIAKEKHRLSDELRRQAHYDLLTDLPNRMLLSDRLEQAIRDAGRGGYPVGVLLLDLDEFKLVNDSLGHGAGDELLKNVAARLQECVRAGDTVARLGGDEFVLVVPLRRGEDDCTDVAERLVKVLQGHVHIAGREVSARPSIGISLYPRDGGTPEALLQAADTAMYAAKHAGKNQYRFFAESMNRQVSERMRVQSELQDALRNDELELYFQPRVLLQNDDVCGAEALLRWHHPQRGLLAAGEFIEIAERSPLMSEIDSVVLSQAARTLAAWQRAGRRLVLSANVSARELHADGFVAQVAHTLDQAGVDAAGLELEITESMLMLDSERTRRQLAELKERAPGLRIAVDDFGSGYSSLNYLRQLPIDTLKIDRSFVADLDGVDQITAGAITKTIVEFGRSLGLTVVAEGVEREEQARYLRTCGCHQAQGFLYDAALPVAEFENRLAGSLSA